MICKIAEPNTSQKPPLFRWFRGRLELAVLPHFLESVPEPLEQKGKAALEEGTAYTEAAVSTALCERPVSQLSCLAWNDAEFAVPNMNLKWLSPNHKVISSRKAAEEHAMELVNQQLFLDKIILGYGARGQKLRPTKPTKADALKAGKLRFLRDGMWVVGQEEAWQASRADELELEAKDKPPPARKRNPSALQCYLLAKRKACQADKQKELDEMGEKRRYTLKEAETELKAVWKTLSKEEKATWKFVDETVSGTDVQIDSTTSHQTTDDATGERTNEVTDSSNEILRKVTEESASKDEQVETMNGDNGVEKCEAANHIPSKVSGIDLYIQSFRQKAGTPPTSIEKNPKIKAVDANPCDDSFFRTAWQRLPEAERLVWIENAKLQTDSKAAATASEKPNGIITPGDSETDETSASTDDANVVMTADAAESVSTKAGEGPVELESSQGQPAVLSTRDEAPLTVCAVGSGASTKLFSFKRRRPLSMCPPRRFSQSSHWRMTQSQMDLCYSATIEHFEKVMNTVKARALHAELADGFDLLRERGRGRYDMELPAFDGPNFQFLTDLAQAPWMPVVKQILGEEVALIHKGVFLSMPGAEAQDYHQDGPHLSTKVQRPCHAVNVFIPLVDLCMRNGPTEFLPGSHILGHDGYDRSKIVVPMVPAGTPVIFDYRLGHRGLGNSSNDCRPIVYCTYAAAANGKEFRDSVNFSRKRYHKIGELVDKPLSREERTRKRKLAQEERICLKLISEHETATKSKETTTPPQQSSADTTVTQETKTSPQHHSSSAGTGIAQETTSPQHHSLAGSSSTQAQDTSWPVQETAINN